MSTVVDRANFQAELDALALRVREDFFPGRGRPPALPTVEVDPTIKLIGPQGTVTLLDAFEGRQRPVDGTRSENSTANCLSADDQIAKISTGSCGKAIASMEGNMGSFIAIQFVTLDGVTEDPDGSQGSKHGGLAFRFGPQAVA